MSWIKNLINWGEVNGRKKLPWSSKDPYRVWVSEIMLQQTQVETVKEYYERFLTAFPNVKSLANASEDDVMRQWAGLGYYRRAKLLHQGAQFVVKQWGDIWKETPEDWIAIPGIGETTANAICSFCFNKKVAIFDGNVARFMARFLACEKDILGEGKRFLWNYLKEEVKSVESKKMPILTQTMMDLGATICKPKKPDCEKCPLKNECKAHLLEKEEYFPIKKKKESLKPKQISVWFVDENLSGLVVNKNERTTGVWQGLWVPQEEKISKKKILFEFVHKFSHYDLTVQVKIDKKIKKSINFKPIEEIEKEAIPTALKKVIENIKKIRSQ